MGSPDSIERNAARESSAHASASTSTTQQALLPSTRGSGADGLKLRLYKVKRAVWTFGKFVGPGFMVSVAYSKSAS